jgi:CBS-domain-containing membrane protein
VLGQAISALIGVSISKLFQLRSDYEEIKWIAGAIACGCSSAVMLVTGTVHPPGGASAVLAATDPVITAMGWYFVGLVVWGTVLMLLVGLVINNMQRQFPMYWWTPMKLEKAKKQDLETVPDGRGGVEKNESDEDRNSQEEERIEITGTEVTLPESLSLNQEEAELLERLQDRLRKRADAAQEGNKLGSADSKNSRSSVELASRV